LTKRRGEKHDAIRSRSRTPLKVTGAKSRDLLPAWTSIFEEYDPAKYAEYLRWRDHALSTKELAPKVRELIIVAIDCYVAWPSPFIDTHINGAFDAGASIQEVLETIVTTAWFNGHALIHGLIHMEKVIREREAGGMPFPAHHGPG
jgi:alkylhydroperoxidase/carboxymuconolactone decarboxylase family protein YurZ